MAPAIENEFRYLAFDEKILLLRRLHPVAAVAPLVRAVLIGGAVMWSIGGQLGPLPVVAGVAILGIQWIRDQGFAGNLGFVRVGLVLGLLWAGVKYGVPPDLRWTLVILISVASGIWGVIDHRYTFLYLTDKRIVIRSGLLDVRRSSLPHRSLTDVRYDQTWLGDLADYGHFFVESAGQDQALSSIRFVRRPRRFYRIVLQLALYGDVNAEQLAEY